MKQLMIFLALSLLSTTFCIGQNDSKPLVPGKRAHHAIIYADHLEKVLLMGGSTPVNDGASFVFL